jgi:hypothetical protein
MKRTIVILLLHCLTLLLYGMAYVILHNGLSTWCRCRSGSTGGRRHCLPSSTT